MTPRQYEQLLTEQCDDVARRGWQWGVDVARALGAVGPVERWQENARLPGANPRYVARAECRAVAWFVESQYRRGEGR